MAVDAPAVYPEVYPYLDPARFKGTHVGKVVLVTGELLAYRTSIG